MDYNLKGGVLLIGSLFWQDHRDDEGDGIRKNWRDNRLLVQNSVNVSLPIRYGRFSRDEIYTMVFDNGLSQNQYGKGKAVPLRTPIANWVRLREEVEALSNAEGDGRTFIKGNRAWCVCGIIFNRKVDPEKRNHILNQWNQALRENSRGFSQFERNLASYGLTLQGELQIPWPKQADKFDFFLAASNLPQNREMINELTVQEIVSHIGNRPYFTPNFLRGIGTYQDRQILKLVNTDIILVKQLFKNVVEHYQLRMQDDLYHRYWSWNHCYEVFHSEEDNNLKALCLANYLASWGMYRGSGGLLQKSYKIHLKAIEILSDAKYHSLDCYDENDFIEDNIELLFQLERELSQHYSSIRYERMGGQFSLSPTDTLVSKILLGILSCSPAHDEFLKVGLQMVTLENKRFDKKGLASLLNWIEQFEIQTLRNDLPENTRRLPIMKLLDIYFWSLGYSLSIIEK